MTLEERIPEREDEELDLAPSPRLLEMLGEIPFKPWQCFAELIDNSFDDFLRDEGRDQGDPPSVQVTLPKASTADDGALVCVADNGRGMTKTQLEQALRAGYSANARYGSLGLFGMGFNIATARLGSLTEVRTTRAGETHWHVVEIDFREMRKRGHFRVPLRRELKDDPGAHGTEIIVRRLRPEMRDTLKRTNTASSIRDRLGNVYSYLLRDKNPVPEVPDGALAGRGYALHVNGIKVRSWLPCAWSASRTVMYKGTEIAPIQIVDRTLSPAWACMDCGHWHKVEMEACIECESDSLELRERRIHGWLGIQRYFDTSDFGIDFLRNGRKILMSDHSLFNWENPDTGEKIHEYPIELGSSVGGRIIGEVHLDHVPVTYQKNDFRRGERDWITAVDVIRGEGPLLPRKAQALGYPENSSPLSRLFGAFRDVKPGLKYLVPGDGRTALHVKSREWAKEFRKGRADFLSDERWYEAARTHDEIANGAKPKQGATPATGTRALREKTGLDEPEPGTFSPPRTALTPPTKISKSETEEQRFARYRAKARVLHDLSGTISVGRLAKRNVRVFETPTEMLDLNGKGVPTLTRTVKGGEIEVYVHGDHEIFREFGRDTRDFAIIAIAEALRTEGKSEDAITSVTAEVTRQFPDQRLTDAVLRDRSEALLKRVRDLMNEHAFASARGLWADLPIPLKETAERNAASTNPRLDWRSATADGSFVTYLDGAGLATLLRARPELFFDGNVFNTAWKTWTDAHTRTRQVDRLARLLETISGFLSDTGVKSRLELSMTRITLEMLADEISQEEP